MRRIAIIIASLAAAAAVAAATAPPAQGVSQGQLENAGWDCPFVLGAIHCAPPGGLARVLSGEAETMSFLVFRTSDGQYLGTEHIVRATSSKASPARPTRPAGSTRTSYR